MGELPTFLSSGERARLFPVLADTSREGRATSIFLACLANVREFADELLSSVGRGIGINSKVSTYTEICFSNSSSKTKFRPDGLINVETGRARWSALVESKIGNAELSRDQIESYLKLARENDINAVITISNQHATSAADHPVKIDGKLLGKTTLYHWSWMDILTTADLLLSNGRVEDREQKIMLNEFRRFLSHDSTGVRGFDRMPPEWPALIGDINAGAQINPQSDLLKAVVRAWHLELRDLSLILSRQIGVPVSVKLSKQEARHPADRLKNDCVAFCNTQCLSACLTIPEAAADIEITIDVRSRTLAAGAKLIAPLDRKSTSARLNWLLRQISEVSPKDVFVRVHWPRRGYTQYPLEDLRHSLDRVISEHSDLVPMALEVLMVNRTERRFAQVSKFVEDIEKLVPTFYGLIGSKLKAWQPSAPSIRPERNESSDVSTEAIYEDAEEAVAELSEPTADEPSKKKFWF